MKTEQFKLMLGWSIGLSAVCIVLLIFLLFNVMSIKKQVKTLSANGIQSASSSQQSTSNNSTPTSSDSTQLTCIQNSLNTLVARPAPTTSASSGSMTCSGTLSQSLSGSASQIGSFTDYNLSGSSPINLTCNNL